MNIRKITDSSALVVAHPDDEILWFSSILEQIDEVVFCFMGVRSSPGVGRARQQSLSSYPLKKVSCLGLEESEVLNGADWHRPIVTDFGLKVVKSEYSLPGFSEKVYRTNYAVLVTELEHRLAGCRNVFTHNPWGEYGNEEHVQVYRAVNALRKRMGFNLWFSNYCSNKSCNMMAQYISEPMLSFAIAEPNKELAKKIQALYQRNNCWTWYNNYEWPAREAFLTCREDTVGGARDHQVFPVNMITTELPKEYAQRGKVRRWWNMIARPLRQVRSWVRRTRYENASGREAHAHFHQARQFHV